MDEGSVRSSPLNCNIARPYNFSHGRCKTIQDVLMGVAAGMYICRKIKEFRSPGQTYFLKGVYSFVGDSVAPR